MNFQEMLRNDLFHLPIKQNGNGYRDTIKKLFSSFLNLINGLDFTNWYFEDLTIHTEYILDVQKDFTNGLLRVIDIYYDGKPAQAYHEFHNVLYSTENRKDFREILKIYSYQPETNFYRMRIKADNFSLQPLDMFHIPFELRGRISTQRYSIPGFPCLYLGLTLYGCWEEMNRPGINDFQAVRLSSTKEIKYLDLTPPPPCMNNMITKNMYHYFMLWPLIASCSVIVNDYSKTFKEEYIIPQLLLQWVRNENDKVDAIRYNSTHIDINNMKSVGDFSNLVIPVKNNKDFGHCDILRSMFKTTYPVSWQLKEFAMGGGVWMGSREDDIEINNKIPQLELIKGVVYPYSTSVLGNLEYYLNFMQLSDL